jgi:thiamine biosynthesis protein ThiI
MGSDSTSSGDDSLSRSSIDPPSRREVSPAFAVVHYHEIALKKRNRPHFVARLARNIEAAVSDLPVRRVVPLPGRLLVELDDEAFWPELRERLAHVMGIANYSRANRVPLDIDTIADAVVNALEGKQFDSFRITTRRANKKFHLNSMDIDRQVGGRVKEATGSQVNLSAPELTVFIEVLPREAFFYFEKFPGSRGVPVGTGGKVVALLSGGIDSPVAAYRMLKRGCRVTFIHFHSVPFLSRASQQKAKELTELLNRYQQRSVLYLVKFGELQRQIMLTTPTALRVGMYRRFMLRIATKLAKHRRARALVTGESLGQVASQTLDNIAVIEQAAGFPVLRPLIGMDKEEIIAQAKAIRTYDISILPDQDCCQLFIPIHPATRSRLWEVEAVEEKLDVEEMVEAAVREAEQNEFHFPRLSKNSCQAFQ